MSKREKLFLAALILNMANDATGAAEVVIGILSVIFALLFINLGDNEERSSR